MQTHFTPAVLAAFAALLSAAPSPAAIVSGAGTNGDTFSQIAPPPSVGNNDQQTNNTLFAFNEKQDQVLAQAIDLDLVPIGDPTTLLIGTAVSSHYVFADPSASLNRVTGSVTFDQPILGVIFDDTKLDATNTILGTAGGYDSPSLLGLESGDIVTLTAIDTVTIDFTAGSPGDYIRVITQGVPEPSSLTTLALAATAMTRRRRT